MIKTIAVTAALSAATIAMQAQAFAQSAPKAPVYRYCLLESGTPRSGGGSTLCRFNTYAQCMASKTGWSDTCIINPQLTYRR